MIRIHPRTGEARMSLSVFSALEFAGACRMVGVVPGDFKPAPRKDDPPRKVRRRRRKSKPSVSA